MPGRCARKACWLKEEALGCGPPFPTKEQRTRPGSCTRAHTGCCGPGAQATSTASLEQGRLLAGRGPASQAPRCREAVRVATGHACCAPRAGPAAGATDAETQATTALTRSALWSMHTPVSTHANTRHSAACDADMLRAAPARDADTLRAAPTYV